MDWLENAWDSFTGLFGGGSEVEGNPQSGIGQSVLGDIDIDNSGDIGGMDISDYKPGYDYSSVDDQFGGYSESFGDPFKPAEQGNSNTPGKPGDKPWYSSLLSPAVLGAMVTSGSSLLGGLSSLNAQKEQQKAAQEQQKMNQLLELAKLKYQLLGKGAKTSGGRRSGGGSSSGQNADAQASAQLANGYQSLGNNLSSIYR